MKPLSIQVNPKQLQLLMDGLDILQAIGIQRECDGAGDLMIDLARQFFDAAPKLRQSSEWIEWAESFGD